MFFRNRIPTRVHTIYVIMRAFHLWLISIIDTNITLEGGIILKTDVQIAQEAKMLPITEVAERLGLEEDDLIQYGKYKAKIKLDVLEKLQDREDGKLVLVTAINPTPAGEGKTTTNIGLSMGVKQNR